MAVSWRSFTRGNVGAKLVKEAEMSRESEQIKKCAEWLTECLRLGWPKESLDALEALWWKYHGEE